MCYHWYVCDESTKNLLKPFTFFCLIWPVWLEKNSQMSIKVAQKWVSESVWLEKNSQMSIKVAQKWFNLKNDRFWHLFKNCLRMWEIWTNELLPKALKSCPKCKKSPNLVTLNMAYCLLRCAAKPKLVQTCFQLKGVKIWSIKRWKDEKIYQKWSKLTNLFLQHQSVFCR